MKLRNKKTGGIVDFITIDLTGKGEIEFVFIAPDGDERGWKYNSLESFNEEWEDYKPAEPLIKDEKVRKAVRAWAEANDIDPERYYDTNVKFDFLEHRLKWIETSIEFNDITGLENLEDGESYTIDELCGEEEE